MSMRISQCRVGQLKEALSKLNDNDIVQVNPVNNLNVYRKLAEPSEYDWEWIYIIELGNEELGSMCADLSPVKN